VAERSGLDVASTPGVDAAQPAESAVVSSRRDAGGHTQVRVVVTPTPAVDPADPKPEVKADEPKPEVKAEDKPAVEQTPTVRPTWLPEKFETPQALKDATVALAKKQGLPGYVIRGIELSESGQEVSDAYTSFEKNIDPNAGKPADPKPEVKAEEKPPVAEPAPTVTKTPEEQKAEREELGVFVADMLDKVGIRAVDLREEFTKNGMKVTEQTYGKFEAAGVSRQFLDAYISGAVSNGKALAEQHVKDIKATVGGEEAFGKLSTWGSANMSKEQHEIYSTMTNSGSVVAAKKAVEMLKGWYDAANGKPPTLVKQVVPETPKAENLGYGSNEEMMADMADPRYKNNDKAFHRKVEEKLRFTNLR
jgi:hypothetical protein